MFEANATESGLFQECGGEEAVATRSAGSDFLESWRNRASLLTLRYVKCSAQFFGAKSVICSNLSLERHRK
jgi:hypothetical protein